MMKMQLFFVCLFVCFLLLKVKCEKKWDKLRGELFNIKESGLDDLGYS